MVSTTLRQIIFVGIIILTTFSCSRNKKENNSEKLSEEKKKYSVTTPLIQDTSVVKEYIAQIQSIKNIEIRAQEKGYLQKIFVDEGQSVKAGQLMFKIMPQLIEAELNKAKALVSEAQVELDNAKILADKNIISKSEVAIKQAKLDEAKADVTLAEVKLSFTNIKAPFSGIIDRIRFKLGSLIEEGGLLTSLSDNNSVYAYFNLGESEYLNFMQKNKSKIHQTVQLKLANGEIYNYKGEVETIEGEFDNETGTIAFRAKFPNPNALLKHGETGKIQMKVDINKAMIIPQKATYEMQDKIYVFVLDKNNTVKSRNITVKSKLPDIYIVESGLEEGEKFLLDGVQIVKDDDKVVVDYKEPKSVISNLQLIK